MTTGTLAAEALPAAGSSFYTAMRILPGEQRAAMYAIYAFCRAVDDVADEPGDRRARHDELEAWRAEVEGVPLAPDAVTAAQGAEATIVLTEWPVFRTLDWAAMAGAMKRPIVVDTRNLVDPATLRRAGVTAVGLGRRGDGAE